LKGKLARSSLQTSALLAARVATQGLVLILLARLLEPATYGSFAAASSLAVVFGILPNLGSGFVMLARGAQDDNGIGEVWRYAWPLNLCLGLLLLLAYLCVANVAVHPSLPLSVLLTVGSSELLLMPFAMLLSFALQARGRVPLSQFVQWLPLGLRVLAIIPCFNLPPSQRLVTFAFMQWLASFIGAAIGLRITTLHTSLKWRPRKATWHELKTGTSYAVMQLIAANPTEIDKIIALRTVGAYEAGIYTATARAMSAAVMPVTAMLLSALPQLFRHAQTPSEEGHRLIKLILGASFAWGCCSGLLLSLTSPILPILFGPSFVAMTKLMPWLAAAAPMLALRLSAGSILMALGRPLERVSFELCGIVVLVAGILVLAPTYGTRGIAVALFAAETSMTTLGWWLVRRRMAHHHAYSG
jgi:O-antigen/teichoic acid export membrane protein